MKYILTYRFSLPEIHKLSQLLYNSMVLSSATAERTFSTMRCIKSWLRSNMVANNLSNRIFANLQKEHIGDINIETVTIVLPAPLSITYRSKVVVEFEFEHVEVERHRVN